MSALRRALAAALRPGALPGPAERLRLRLLPRYRPTSARLLGRRLQVVDANTFLGGVSAIFNRRCYDFPAASAAPLIVDCGANIGLSCIFFKRRYPRARLVAFEPDPQIFAALRTNLRAFDLYDVALYNQAVWTGATTLRFWREGGFSGRLARPGDERDLIEVRTVRLRDFLAGPVDLLKLDVEGAETAVLADCADRLDRVANLFVEYHAPAHEAQTLHTLLALLDGAGFRYHLREAYAAAQPFVARPPLAGMEYQVDIYAYRQG